MNQLPVVVVIISADTEWRAVRDRLAAGIAEQTPYGEAISMDVGADGTQAAVVFVHGGWGKIAAAGSAQYAIDRWQPDLLVNLGTCGGFAGDIAPGTLLVVDYTLVYDIHEQMGDPDEALAHYATELDLSWLRGPLPEPFVRGMLISADRDIVVEEIAGLRDRYGATAADWETAAIAYVARRNEVRALLLRGVSDVVGREGGEAYGDLSLFEDRAVVIMNQLLDTLPTWLALALP